ncbi:MAG TPA: hypothetical protein VK524_11265 [Polyangiaceae bacterium]|nr:hypothetical protein [Polyangiaceae bacterium]
MKQLSAGSEIDAYCTKCRMDLGHRVIAMVGPAPKRVICQTCNSQHNYRAPRSEPRAKTRTAGSPARAASEGRSASGGGRGRAEQERRSGWEARISGKALTAFIRYSMERRFSAGDLILHSKFGEGYVTEVDGGKMNVMFQDGARTLAHKSAN